MSYWCSHNHYYYDPPQLELGDVLERLKRKYQAYKRAVLLENKKAGRELYQEMFTVDYEIEVEDENGDKQFDRYVIN